MDCERYRKNLTDIALGAMESRRQAEFAAHLAVCAGCHAALERERRLLAAIDIGIAASVAAEPSPEFAARVRQRLEQKSLSARSRFSTWVPATAVALVVLGVVAVWLARRRPVVPGTPEPPAVASQQRPTVTAPAAEAASRARPSRPTEQAATPRGATPARGHLKQVVAQVAEPEVLVPPGQHEAVLQLYAALRSGRVDPASLVAPSAPLEPAELKIAPLEVPKLEEEAK